MRELKYRAWDYLAQKYVYSGTPTDDSFATFWKEWWYKQGNLSVPEQYTGLKDKYGVEIYEGDIVRTSDGAGKIIWEAPAYWFEPFYTWVPQVITDQFDCDVIGNIYENPELLEKSAA